VANSFRRLAINERAPRRMHYSDPDRRIFIAVIAELAHAISRGRKPTSCSLLPGANLQKWLTLMFHEINHASFCMDHMGENCSMADYYLDWLAADYDDENSQKAMRAISLVKEKILRYNYDAYTWHSVNYYSS